MNKKWGTDNGSSKGVADKVLKFERSSERYLKLATDKYDNNDLFGSLLMLRRAEELAPDDEEVKLRIAETLVEMQCYDTAMDSLAPLLHEDGELCVDAVNTLGYCYMGIAEYGAALDAFHYFLNNLPDDCMEIEISSVYNAIEYCESLADMDDGDEAEPPILRDVGEMKKEELFRQAGSLIEEGKPEQAIALLEPELKRYNNDLDLVNIFLTACYCGHEYEKGIEIIESLSEQERELFEKSIRSLCVCAMLYYGVGAFDKAAEICTKLMETDIDTIDELLRVCIVMLECGHGKDALDLAKRVYNDAPYDKNVIHNYARTLYENGDAAGAGKLYERILVMYPNNIAAKYYLKLCNEQPDSKHGYFAPELQLPASEVIARLTYVEQLFKSGELNVPEAWEDERFRDAAEWTLSDIGSPFYGFFMMLSAMADSTKLPTRLTRILIDPRCPMRLRNTALQLFADMGDYRMHFAYSMGRLLCGTAYVDRNFADARASYRRVWECFKENYTGGDAGVSAAAERLMAALISGNTDIQPSLPVDQQVALAAAIEYHALKDSEIEADADALIEKYGITQRRFKNALQKLIYCVDTFEIPIH